MTPDTGAQPGEMSPADGSGPRELLRYRSAQGRWEVAAIILGASMARDRLHGDRHRAARDRTEPAAGFRGLQRTVTSYTQTLASLILLAGSLSDHRAGGRVFLAGLSWFTLASVPCVACRDPELGN